MTVNPTRDEFAAVARMHLRAADASAGHQGGQPKSAAYLAHVAAECAIKYRILARQGKNRTEEMKTVLGNLYNEIFKSADGHDLRKLGEHVQLRRLLEAEKRTKLLDGEEWKRMTNPPRPYALRYGTERLGIDHARSEIVVVKELANILLQGSNHG